MVKLKYFYKYLPVEGEIKDTEKYIYLGYPVDNVVFTYTKDSSGPPLPFELATLKRQKVKLFLCSTDIQVGDTIQ